MSKLTLTVESRTKRNSPALVTPLQPISEDHISFELLKARFHKMKYPLYVHARLKLIIIFILYSIFLAPSFVLKKNTGAELQRSTIRFEMVVFVEKVFLRIQLYRTGLVKCHTGRVYQNIESTTSHL